MDTRSAWIYGKRTNVGKTQTKNVKNSEDITSVILHEGQHVADNVNHPIKSFLEKATKTAALFAGAGLGLFLTRHNLNLEDPNPREALDVLIISLSSILLTNSLYYLFLEQGEKRAQKTEKNKELLEKYKDVIVFESTKQPKSS